MTLIDQQMEALNAHDELLKRFAAVRNLQKNSDLKKTEKLLRQAEVQLEIARKHADEAAAMYARASLSRL